MAEFIPKDQCLERRLYRIRSRNLLYGVYRAETGGFLGIREKFGHHFVFEEYHHDNGPPYGTVHPEADLDIDLPEGIELQCLWPGSWNKDRTRKVEWKPDEPDGKVGKWFYMDTGELVEREDGPFCHDYKPLFDWLMEQEKNDAPWVIEIENKVDDERQPISCTAALVNRLSGERVDLGEYPYPADARWQNRELLETKNKEHRDAR